MGGMATVFRAMDTRHLQEVALKVLSPTISGDRRFVRRFRREAGMVARLDHPHIVPVIDYGEAGGYVYLVMPFVDGETLYERMRRGPIDGDDLIRWVVGVAEALEYAHRRGIIHRDVKPSNVLIDEQGEALLTDFGLARWIEGSNTLTGSMLMGTPAYVSPEQGRGEKLDPRSDQYSFAVILYELATGRLPFESEAPMATVLMHIQEPVPRPRRFNPDLPPAVDTVLLKGLAKRREDRFPSVLALSKAFAAAWVGKRVPGLRPPPEPVAAPYEAPTEVDVGAVRPRRRSGAVLASALGAAALALVGFLGWSALRPGGPANSSPPSPQPAAVLPTSSVGLVAPTRPPPTATMAPVTAAACPELAILSFEVEGNKARWLLDNGSGKKLTLLGLDLEWPQANGEVEAIAFGGTVISEGTQFLEGVPRELESGRTAALEVTFPWGASPADGSPPAEYSLRAIFDQDCVLEGSW